MPWYTNLVQLPTWWHFDTLEGVHMLFSLPCHLKEPGCQLSDEALQGFERCFPLLHGPSYQIKTINCHRIHHQKCQTFGASSLMDVRICCFSVSFVIMIIRTICILDSWFDKIITLEHCCNTPSLKLENPSWTLGWFRGNDRKCVKGCFFRKLSTRTSTLVTAEETAALWEPVITVRQRMKVEKNDCALTVLSSLLNDPHQSVLPLLVLGCWLMSLCQTPDVCVSLLFSLWYICGYQTKANKEFHTYYADNILRWLGWSKNVCFFSITHL